MAEETKDKKKKATSKKGGAKKNTTKKTTAKKNTTSKKGGNSKKEGTKKTTQAKKQGGTKKNTNKKGGNSKKKNTNKKVNANKQQDFNSKPKEVEKSFAGDLVETTGKVVDKVEDVAGDAKDFAVDKVKDLSNVVPTSNKKVAIVVTVVGLVIIAGIIGKVVGLF